MDSKNSLKEGTISTILTELELIFALRRGWDLTTDVKGLKASYYLSEEKVKQLTKKGFNWIWLPFFKGAGLKAEEFTINATKRNVSLCHKYGLRTLLYVGDTILYETFFLENPGAKDWIQKTIDGSPVYYGQDQNFRYRWCFNNPNYLDFMKKIIRIGIEEIKADGFFFDNLCNSPIEESCFCEFCKKQFREFLYKKYDKETLEERLGFSDLREVIPPAFNRWKRSWDLWIIRNPLLQEWIDFRCQSLSNIYKEISSYIKKLNPEAIFEVNTNKGINGQRGENSLYVFGVDLARILPFCDFWWNEELTCPPSYSSSEDGTVLSSRIRSLKISRGLNVKNLDRPMSKELSHKKLFLAENLAFNNCCLGTPEQTEGLDEYIKFFRKYISYYQNVGFYNPILVYRSFPSLAYNLSTHQTTTLVEQVLVCKKIPFKIIFDLERLSPSQVLILPNSESMNDREVEKVEEFVGKGGKLLVIGETAFYDQWRRKRSEPGLKEIFRGNKLNKVLKVCYRRGKAVYIPKVIPAISWKGEPINIWAGIKYPAFEPTYWKLPENTDEIVEAIGWLYENRFPIEVNGPDYLAMEFLSQKGRILLHLVNYSLKKVPGTVKVQMVLGKKRINKVTLLSPDRKETVALDFSVDKDTISFEIRGTNIYDLVVMEV